jgi:steroid delta-isomerase-like uncharacterized protein
VFSDRGKQNTTAEWPFNQGIILRKKDLQQAVHSSVHFVRRVGSMKPVTHFLSQLHREGAPHNTISQNAKDSMSTQNNCAIVSSFIEEGINQGHIDSIAKYVCEDVVEQVPFPGQGPGIEGLKDVLRGMRTAFPDLHFAVEEQIAEGDKVLTRFEWTGTQLGEFLGVPATGRPVKVWGMVLDRLVEGRIKDTRIIMDIFGLMMQLGALGS